MNKKWKCIAWATVQTALCPIAVYFIVRGFYWIFDSFAILRIIAPVCAFLVIIPPAWLFFYRRCNDNRMLAMRDKKKYMLKPISEEYNNNDRIRALVDALCNHLRVKNYTEFEVRDAANLACIMYNSEK